MAVCRRRCLVLGVMAAVALLAGCAQTPSPTLAVVAATRLMARFEGRLLEHDGCYFAGSEDVTFAWPPEFVLERRGEILRVMGGWGKGEVWDLPIGEVIVTGGGWVSIPEDELAEFRVLPHCPKTQFVVFGGADKKFQITPEP